jgi:enediyne biosynthesis protein E7
LRLYPPGWLLSRRTIGADVLGGYPIPAGADVLLSPYLLHRHPRFWKDPDAFRPERFAPEHEAERPRFAYMPFAAGPRHCIGETFALYEMLVHLYKVARHYRLTYASEEPIELEAQINLRTRKPLYMRLECR